MLEKKTDTITLDLYKTITEMLAHEVNNKLQEILWSVEKMSAHIENGEESKKAFNPCILAATSGIFAVRDLCVGYSNFFQLPINRHLELAVNAYEREINLTGDAETLPEDLKLLLTGYIYILAKTTDAKINVEEGGVRISGLKNPANFVPNEKTFSGRFLVSLAQERSITQDGDSILIAI